MPAQKTRSETPLVFFSYISTWRSRGMFPALLVLCHANLMRRTFCDTTMYLYVSEIFPTEIRPIGMGFSLFGQFAGMSPHLYGPTTTDNDAATLVLLETAPMGFNNIGWKYYLVIICWSAFFIPGKTDTRARQTSANLKSHLLLLPGDRPLDFGRDRAELWRRSCRSRHRCDRRRESPAGAHRCRPVKQC
jgi:hypothetical protein